MSHHRIMQVILLAFLGLKTVSGIEPISTGIVLGISALAALYDNPHCRVFECCDDRSVLKNITGLQDNLRNHLHGQHLVQNIVVGALTGHLQTNNPAKALVLSLHGPQGSGKNFVSNFIRDAMLVKGKDSKFYKLYSCGHHFPTPSKAEEYKEQLREEIKLHVRACERFIFIFDDVQKMPQTVLDAVKPFIDHHEKIDGLDFRKSIFIFLSNTGQTLIVNKALEIWRRGGQREDIKLSDFESLIKKGAFNEKGGLHQSETVVSNLIDHYIPFLPLEEKHVIMCIRDEFRKRGYFTVPEDAKQSILQDMTFIPEKEKIFSSSGCKRVSAKVSTYIFAKTIKW